MTFKLAMLAGASTIIFAAPAAAQEASGSTVSLEEIVVTAQKREQNLQSVPVAVTAVTGRVLEAKGINQFQDLSKIAPSLTITQSTTSINNSILLRGVGTFAFSTAVEPSVAVVVDDLAVLQQGQAFAGLSDVERVEVLRGPQGTLFGKSASAGVVNIVTRTPSRKLSGSATVSATSDEQYRAEGSVTGPVGERAAFRLNGFYGDNHGYVKNLSTGHDLGQERSWGLRGRLNLELSDKLTLDLIASHADSKGNGISRTFLSVPAGATLFGAPVGQNLAGIQAGFGNDRLRNNIDPISKSVSTTASARLNWSLGFANLISITGYQRWEFLSFEDVDATETPVFGVAGGITQRQPVESTLWTQELRLVSATKAPLEYVLGLYYADGETGRFNLRTLGTPLAASWNANSGTRTYAVFGQATYNFTERTHVDLGLRYNNEHISVDFTNFVTSNPLPAANAPCLTTCAGDSDQSRVTGKIALRQDLTQSVMGYVSYATGYKGQGYDVSTGFTPARAARPVAAEDSKSYEIGLKSRFLDNRVQINAAAFLTNYDNFQAQSAITLPNGSIQFNLSNVGKLRTQGLELEAMARPIEPLLLSASAAYTDATILSFPAANCYTGQTTALGCIGGLQNLAGRRLPNSPKFKYTLSANYDVTLPGMPFKGFISADYRHQSEVIFDLSQNPSTVQPEYGVFDASVGIHESENDRYRLTFFVKNLFDKSYSGGIGGNTGSSLGLVSQLLPRDYKRYFGVRLNAQF